MTKKVLLIDPLSPIGHKKYNEILIADIVKSGCDLDLISKSKYFDFLDKKNLNINQVLEIDEKYYRGLDKKAPLINRIKYFKILLNIKKNIDFSKYDYIIFSSYEESSFLFANFKFRCYLINHNNLSGINKSIKKYIIKKISKSNRLIVLHENFVDLLNQKGIESMYVAHGLPKKIKSPYSIVLEQNSIGIQKADLIIFSPSSSSSDNVFFEKLISDLGFIKFIEENNILLILKGNYVSCSESILILESFLDQKDYDKIFDISDVILINYNENFKNRVSGVFYECIANNKIILTSKYFFYNLGIKETAIYTFNDIPSLKKKMIEIIRIKQGLYKLCLDRDKKAYEPNIIYRIEDDCK